MLEERPDRRRESVAAEPTWSVARRRPASAVSSLSAETPATAYSHDLHGACAEQSAEMLSCWLTILGWRLGFVSVGQLAGARTSFGCFVGRFEGSLFDPEQ